MPCLQWPDKLSFDDFNDVIEKLHQCHDSISCLSTDKEAEQMLGKIYHQISLDSLENSYQIENQVRKCRNFIEKFQQIIDNSIEKTIGKKMATPTTRIGTEKTWLQLVGKLS